MLFLFLSIANNQSQSSSSSSSNHPSHSTMPLDANEQQLLDAIHAHPNKRDLVLNLLRQMNESSQPPPPMNSNYQTQQRRLESAPNYDPYRSHSTMDDNQDLY